MRLFLCRQYPFNDKTVQSHDIIEEYINYYLHTGWLPIPYLHNSEILNHLQISKDDDDLLEKVKNTQTLLLDTRHNVRNQKRTRILNLLYAIFSKNEMVKMIVPFQNTWFIITCGKRISRISSHYVFDKNKKIKSDIAISNDAMCVEITSWKIVDSMQNIRLPPVSLQELKKNHDAIVQYARL